MSILSHIRVHGGSVVRDGYRFSLRRGRLTPHALAWIKANMDAVKREVWPAFDDWQERAAIMEFEGGLTREEAERAAWECMEARRADAA